MDALKELWVLRYRAGVQGVQTGFIQAPDELTAMEIGQVYCDRNPNYRFIGVETPILADVGILEDEAKKINEPALAEIGVVQAMAKVKSGALDPREALREEQQHARRVTLINYLEQFIADEEVAKKEAVAR